MTSCALRPACDTAGPNPGMAGMFRSSSNQLLALGGAKHRGRDLFVASGQHAWALGRFAYGVLDSALQDEDVEVFLLESCSATATWRSVATVRTSTGMGTPVLGVADNGGRVFLDLGVLPVGRHRVHFVVRGDLTAADQFIEVLPPGARIAVTDIDGTLTTSEFASWTDYIGGTPPDAHPGAAAALTALAQRGYRLFYLTARPEWLEPRTLEWVTLRGFPQGIVHTTLGGLGVSGAAAITFKSGELAGLFTQTGVVPEYGFGNRDTDVAAYADGGVAHTYYYDLPNVDLRGGVNHMDYGALVPTFDALPAQCP